MDSKSQVRWTAEEILDVLSKNREKLQKMGVRKLGLFGSYIRNEQNQESDMDFLVVLDQYGFDDYMDVKFFLEDLFERHVDLVVEDTIKPRLRPYILNEVIW